MGPPGWPPAPPGAPWVAVPLAFRPPAAPVPPRDRWLAVAVIAGVVLGPLAIGTLLASVGRFGSGGLAAFLLAGFFLTIAPAAVLVFDLGRPGIPAVARYVAFLTVCALFGLAAACVALAATPQAGLDGLRLAAVFFVLAAAGLFGLNAHALQGGAMGKALPVLGAVVSLLSVTGGAAAYAALTMRFQGQGTSGVAVFGILSVPAGFVAYLVWAVALAIAAFQRPVQPRGAAATRPTSR